MKWSSPIRLRALRISSNSPSVQALVSIEAPAVTPASQPADVNVSLPLLAVALDGHDRFSHSSRFFPPITSGSTTVYKMPVHHSVRPCQSVVVGYLHLANRPCRKRASTRADWASWALEVFLASCSNPVTQLSEPPDTFAKIDNRSASMSACTNRW